MPVYEYSALNPKGKTITGIIDAESSQAARQKIRAKKNYPVSIKEVLEGSTPKESPGLPGLTTTIGRVKQSEVAMMTRQLSTLLGAGFALVPAIDILVPQTKSQNFKKILARIKDSIVEGKSFAAALSPYPSTFPPLYKNMVSAGETSGTLEIVLERLAEITERQQELKNRIRSAMAYPILMTVLGFVVLFFLMTYIVPNISSIFIEMDRALPAPTEFLINLSALIRNYWWVAVLLLVIAFFVLKSMKKTVKGRFFVDRMKLKIPVFGNLLKKMAVARFCRTLSSLLENGVPLLTSLEIVQNIVDNVLLSEAISRAAREVGKGQPLGASLADSRIFPSLSLQMISVGEQSGELENLLSKVADVYEKEVESLVSTMTSILEPVMILVMGVVVGFIVLSICLPIFEMNQLVK
jgi:general secretion pathway protein F